MRSRKNYSQEFKSAIITKVLNRGERSARQICEEEGINGSTVANWMQARVKVLGMTKEISKNWSPENKLKAISESYGLTGEVLGEYLRKEGLHSHNLEEWSKDFISSLTVKRKNASKKDERDVQIKNLEREVLRKDKALAEASALLILQKKVNLIWGNNEGDEK